MKKITFLVALLLIVSGCKSTKTTYNKPTKTTSASTKTKKKKHEEANPTIENIIKTAETYNGVKYQYGGASKKGMDCSGLMVTAFNSENIELPRTTRDLSTTGDWIDLKKVKKGDLLFFATQKNSRKINHVGLVTETRSGFVEFIHSTTSRGVITSKLSEKYWYFAFVQARRVL